MIKEYESYEYHTINSTDLTASELAETHERIKIVSDNIIYYKNGEDQSYQKICAVFERIDELIWDYDEFYLISDTTEVKKRRSSKFSSYVTHLMRERKKLKFIALIIEDDNVIKAISANVMRRLYGDIDYSITKTVDEAVDTIKKKYF